MPPTIDPQTKYKTDFKILGTSLSVSSLIKYYDLLWFSSLYLMPDRSKKKAVVQAHYYFFASSEGPRLTEDKVA